MNLISLVYTKKIRLVNGALSGGMGVKLIDKSGLQGYTDHMETAFLPARQALLEDAALRDMVTARRKLLVEIISRERYLTRSGLMNRVEMVLGEGCFGDKAWEDNFYRDMRAVKNSFRVAGYELAYSRKKEHPGYYLKGEGEIGQDVALQIKGAVAEVDPGQVAVTKTLSPAERAQQGLSITNLAHGVSAYRRSRGGNGHD